MSKELVERLRSEVEFVKGDAAAWGVDTYGDLPRTTALLDEAATALTAKEEEIERLREALSEGLDLCTRARNMDRMERERIERQMRDPEMTRSATIPMWAEEQYQKDLAAWEAKAKKLMPFQFIARSALSESSNAG